MKEIILINSMHNYRMASVFIAAMKSDISHLEGRLRFGWQVFYPEDAVRTLIVELDNTISELEEKMHAFQLFNPELFRDEDA